MIDDDTIVGRMFTPNGSYFVTLGSYKKYSVQTRSEVEINKELLPEVLKIVPDQMITISELELCRKLKSAYQDGLAKGY